MFAADKVKLARMAAASAAASIGLQLSARQLEEAAKAIAMTYKPLTDELHKRRRQIGLALNNAGISESTITGNYRCDLCGHTAERLANLKHHRLCPKRGGERNP